MSSVSAGIAHLRDRRALHLAATGNIYYGLWYPVVVAGATLVRLLFSA